MNKGVEGSLSVAAHDAVAPDSRADVASSRGSEGRIVRRRRRHRHHRHETLTRSSGRAKEIAFVTFVALALLFAVLYYLLPHYSSSSQHEESGLAPTRGAATALTHPS